MSLVAKNRWKILSKVVQKKELTAEERRASKRRFSTYNLLRSTAEGEDGDGTWYSVHVQDTRVHVRILKQNISLQDLTGM